MSIQFEILDPTPAVKEKISIGGKIVGTVFPYTPSYIANSEELKFQAQLNLSNCMNPGGFGPTKEAAVIDAMKNGNETAKKMLEELAVLASEILAEKGV